MAFPNIAVQKVWHCRCYHCGHIWILEEESPRPERCPACSNGETIVYSQQASPKERKP